MSIFGSIMSAITFGAYKQKTGDGKTVSAPPPAPHPAGDEAADGTAGPVTASPMPAPQPTLTDVDVEAALVALAHGKDLNWQSSIVDLMKLLEIDSSLANRKELAHELGYTGALDGSAEMNIWLHKATMRKLAENGGKVPASMTD